MTNGQRETGATQRVCIIGAGAAGLAAGKALADRGIPSDWYEKGSMVGGLWRIDNDNGGAAAYRTLHLNSSRPLTQYPSHPMPEDWPDYPSHTMMAQYFQDFAEDNDLIRRITFNTEVTSVAPLPTSGSPGENGWSVTTSDGITREYRAVIVSNGHHSVPKVPEFPAPSKAKLPRARLPGRRGLHRQEGARHWRRQPGMDIACDACKVADTVYLATRHGVHVIPKYAFGKPIDQFGNPPWLHLPSGRTHLYSAILRLSTGRPQDRGLPKPDHRLCTPIPRSRPNSTIAWVTGTSS